MKNQGILKGFSSKHPMVFNTGDVVKSLEEISLPCTVVKYGAGTGHTIGMLRLCGPAVHKYTTSFRPEDNVHLFNQFEVRSLNGEPFADKGDSGALVFAVSGLGQHTKIRALGLLVGGTDYGSTIVTPIWAVLNMFELPLKLLSFQSEEEHGSRVPPSEQTHDRLQGIERDVDDLKNNLSTLAVNVDHKINTMDNKIDQLSAQTDRTEQATRRTEQEMQNLNTRFTQLLQLLEGQKSN